MKKSKSSKPKSNDSEDFDLPPQANKAALKKKAKAQRAAEALVRNEIETLEELLERLKIKKWDHLIIGDGSGSNWDYPCGWGSTLITRRDLSRSLWAGYFTFGTVNVAELMAYVHPLLWLSGIEEDRREANIERSSVVRVHIVTDSEYVTKIGADKSGTRRNRNHILWQTFELLRRRGFEFHFHWIERDHAALNSYADQLSKLARRLGKRYNLDRRLKREFGGKGVYDVTPNT